MQSLLQGFFDEVPWLKPVLAWCLAALLVFLLLTGPAYLLFPFVRRLREELRAYREGLRNRHSEARATREASCQKLAEDCQKLHSLRQLTIRNSLLQEMLKPLLRSFKRLDRTLSRLVRRFGGIGKALPRLEGLLKEPSVPAFADLPSAENLLEEVRELRIARGTIAVACLFLAILIPLNTAMLSQILRDLGFIPVSLMVLGVPLYVIVAVGLTVFEASVGAIHVFLRPESEDRFHLATIASLCLFLIVAFMEGQFYSQVAPQRDLIVEFPIAMKQGTQYFLWGFGIIGGLSLMGLMWFYALRALLRGNALTELKRSLHRLRNEQNTHLGAVGQAAGEIGKAKAGAEEAGRLVASDNDKAEAVRSTVEQLSKQIEVMREQPPDWALAGEKELGAADVQSLADQAGFWATLALVAVAVLIYNGYETIWYVLGGLSPALYLVLGCAQGLVFFVAGSLFRAGELVIGRTGSRETLVWAPIQNRALGCVVVALLVGAYVYAALRLGGLPHQTVLWAVNLVVGLSLAVAAYYLIPLLTVVRVWLRRAWNLVAAAAEWLWLLFVRLFGTLFMVIEQVLAFLASPIFALRRQPIPSGSEGPSGQR